MFCPDGFITLEEIVDLLHDDVMDENFDAAAIFPGINEIPIPDTPRHRAVYELIEQKHGSEIAREETIGAWRYYHLRGTLFKFLKMILINLLSDNLYATLPSGNYIRLSRGVFGIDFRFRPYLDLCNLPKNLEQYNALPEGYPYFLISDDGYCIDVEGQDRQAEKILGQGLILNRLKEFDGAPICWKPPIKMPIHRGYFLSLATSSKHIREGRSRRRGPKSDRPAALAAYRQLYPDGHEGIDVWTEVERRTGFSKATIWRALREDGD